MSITERLYRALFECQKRGLDPKAIYLGEGFRREVEDSMSISVSSKFHDIKTDKFTGIPLFWVIAPADHLYVAGEFKK